MSPLSAFALLVRIYGWNKKEKEEEGEIKGACRVPTKTSTNRMLSILNRSLKFCFKYLQALVLECLLDTYFH